MLNAFLSLFRFDSQDEASDNASTASTARGTRDSRMVSVLKKNIVTAYKELDAVRGEAQNPSIARDRRNGRLHIKKTVVGL
jgi:hypothetical protein